MNEHGLATSWALDLSVLPTVAGDRFFSHVNPYMRFCADNNAGLSLEVLEERSVLSLNGVFVDKVVSVEESMIIKPEEKISHDDVTSLLLISWETFGKRYHEEDSEYTGGGSHEEAFWRTALADVVWRQGQPFRAKPENSAQLASFRNEDEGPWRNICSTLFGMVVNQASFVT